MTNDQNILIDLQAVSNVKVLYLKLSIIVK